MHCSIAAGIAFSERSIAPELTSASSSTRAGLYSLAREAGIFGAQDGRASINFRVLYQLIKA